MRNLLLCLCFCCCVLTARSQTLGGTAAFNFLNLSMDPGQTASGGINLTKGRDAVGASSWNPALLNKAMDGQVQAAFLALPGKINAYSATGARYLQRFGIMAGAHIQFMDYGSIPFADAAGNVNGQFRPSEYLIQVSAAGNYLEHWTFGSALKFIRSDYQLYRSSAMALDASLLFHDTPSQFTAGLIFRNMGVQLSTFGSEREDLPFDVQIGITKRLMKSPFGLSLTAQRLHQFDIQYRDDRFNSANNFTTNSGFGNKLLNHFIAAIHVYGGQHIEATAGFNHLRRSDLVLANGSSGLAGFSLGLRLKFQKLDFSYARSGYQRGIALNQVGLCVKLKNDL